MMKVILRNIKIYVMHFFLFPGSHSLTVSFLPWYSPAVILNSVVSGILLIVILPAVRFDCDAPSLYSEL